MKTFNQIMSCICMVASVYFMFFVRDIKFNVADLPFVLGFMILLMAALFLMFSIIEERNEEISQLREKMYNFLKR